MKTTQTQNTIPFELVEKYASYQSYFVEFLAMEFGVDIAERVANDYALGCVDRKTVLWNIGLHGEVYGGHVIGYNKQGYIRNEWRDSLTVNLSSDDAMLVGWYIKEEGLHDDITDVADYINGIDTDDFKSTPSIFGLHMMRLYPDKPIALTENHRAALIGAALQPDMNWLSIGGNVRDLEVNILRGLKGKSVMAFPTNHSYYDWCRLAKQVNFCNISVSPLMEKCQTEWKQDIGDILISDFRSNGVDVGDPKSEPRQVIEVQVSPQQKLLNDMISHNPSAGLLIKNLKLELE